MIEWAAIGTAVAGVGVALAKGYATRKVNNVIDAMATGSHPKVPAVLQSTLDAIIKERVAEALAKGEAAAGKVIKAAPALVLAAAKKRAEALVRGKAPPPRGRK